MSVGARVGSALPCCSAVLMVGGEVAAHVRCQATAHTPPPLHGVPGRQQGAQQQGSLAGQVFKDTDVAFMSRRVCGWPWRERSCCCGSW